MYNPPLTKLPQATTKRYLINKCPQSITKLVGIYPRLHCPQERQKINFINT